MLFSEWLRSQKDRQDDVGTVARTWFLVPAMTRKGRINAARLVRVAGVSPAAAEQAIKEYASL